jgi:hypothetical protein
MYDEQLVEIVERLCFSPIRSATPYIAELRARFARRKRGHAHIANCATWEQFCLKVLHRKPNTIRDLLREYRAESNRGRKKPTHPDLMAMLSMLMTKFMFEWPPDRPLLPVINKLREHATQLETLERKRAAERHAEAKRILCRRRLTR